MSLKTLNDQELIEELKNKVRNERDATAQVLRYLKEVEIRRLFLERGYSSLFSFCTEFLAYSESEAYTRIQAMRLLKEMPSIESDLENGNLSLSVAAQAQSAFKRMEKKKGALSATKKKDVISELFKSSTREAERKLLQIFPEVKEMREKCRAISEEETRIEFTANKALLEKLERLKQLMAHKKYSANFADLFEAMADLALEKWEKQKPAAEDAPLLGAPKVLEKSRHIPKVVQRFVWKRDAGKCQYKDPLGGKVCRSMHAVEIDHIRRYADGGLHVPDNLRLYCSAHNKWRERQSCLF